MDMWIFLLLQINDGSEILATARRVFANVLERFFGHFRVFLNVERFPDVFGRFSDVLRMLLDTFWTFLVFPDAFLTFSDVFFHEVDVFWQHFDVFVRGFHEIDAPAGGIRDHITCALWCQF